MQRNRKTIEWKRLDLFKKIVNTKGIFHAEMGTIKDRNGKDLTEAEEIRKSRQEYMEELYRKGLNDPDNHDDVITHLQAGILESKVKWASGSSLTNKADRGDGIPSPELFKIPENNAVKVLHSMCQQILKNSALATGLE